MNKEKITNKVIEFLKQPLIYVVLICIIFQIKLYNSTEKTHISYDSLTYLEFSKSEGILKGKVDEKRTPIYPYFIKIIEKVGGTENLEENITLVQKYLFILTLLLFYACVNSITKNKLIISIATLIFGISPFIIMWNIPILTEPISIFEMTVLALLTIQYLKKPRYILSGSIGFVILIMIMTRPAFIYILPIYFLFWILKLFFNKEEKKQVILGIVSCAVCGMMLLIYCFLMLQQHGKFALTTVSALNNAVSVIQSKTYKRTENKEMIKVIDDALDEDKTIWEAYDVLADRFDEKEIKELVKVATKTPEYKQYLLKKTLELGYNNIGLSYVNNTDISNKDKPYIISYKYIGSTIFPVTFGLLYCVILCSILYLIYNLFKTKNVNWIVAFFTSLIFANIATLIIGAPEEEQRLFSASMPLVMLYVAYIVNLTLKNGGKNEMNKLFYKLFIEKTNDTKLQFFRYIFVGGFAAVINIGSLYFFTEVTHIYYLIANVLGFILGLLTNYILSKWLVFSDENKINKVTEFIIYAIIGIVGLGLDTGFVWLFTTMGFYYMISKIISTALVFIWNFFARKLIYVIIDNKKERG